MSDAITDAEKAPEATDADKAPEVDLSSLPTADYLEAIGGGFDDSSTVADVPAFDAGVAVLVETMPEARKLATALDKAVGAQTAVRMKLAAAIIAVRAAIVIRTAKGDYPDTFGTSKAYRDLFESRIVETILKAGPTSGPGKLDRPFVASELKAVRTGYLNESGTRAKGLLFEAIVQDAVASGKIPGAEVQEDGKVTIPLLTGKGEPKMVPALDAEGVKMKGEDGKPIMRQAVSVYSPGQKTDVPSVVKTAVAQVIAQRDRKDKEGRPLTKVPARFGGKAKDTGGGGDKKDEPRAWNEEMQGALETFSESLGHTATLFQVQSLDKATSVLCDSLNAQKDPGITNPADHAAILLRIAERLKIEAAILEGKTGVETLAPFRFDDSDADKAPEA